MASVKIVRKKNPYRQLKKLAGKYTALLESPTPLLEAMKGIPEPPAPGTQVNLLNVMAELHASHVVSGQALQRAASRQPCCILPNDLPCQCAMLPCKFDLKREVDTGRKKPWKP
jgi:hypothetical protein